MKPYLDLPRPWLVAHRGGASLAPENTLPAFDLAARLGADAFELDVHLTADGEVVVFHDDETSRLTGEPGTIESRTFAEVRTLDAAWSFTPDGRSFPLRGRGVAPPALSEVLARFPEMRMNVEAKSPDPALAAALVAVVRRAGAVERVCIGSQHDAQAERLRALLPEACHFLPEGAATALVMAARAENPTGLPEGWDVADLPYRMEGTDIVVVDRRTIEFLHGRGLAVFAWTVDDESDMRRLVADGADGVMTDRPDLLAVVLGRA